jgi:hypothetical protein
MRTLASLLLLALAPSALAHPGGGKTSVVVVMKMASCPVCATQLRTLAQADLGVSVMGITHSPKAAAARVTAATGVPTYSHAAGIESMGLWLADQGIAQPAVVVYDRCGGETGRIVGRAPGVDVTDEVRTLVLHAEAVEGCGKPAS